MPGLIACGRRWQLSSDDLPIPALIDVCWRMFWLIATGGICLYNVDQWRCAELSPRAIAFLGFLSAVIAGVIFDLPLLIIGTRGTVLNAKPRRHPVHFLYLRLAVMVLEVLSFVYATYAAYSYDDSCPSHLSELFKVVTVVPWVTLPLLFVYIFSVYDPAGRPKDNPRNSSVDAPVEVSRIFRSPTEKGARRQWKSWIRRVKLVCCCAVGFEKGDQECYQRAADVLSAIFQDIDAVPSDLAAALVLMRKREKKLLSLAGSGKPQGPQPVPFADVGDSPSDGIGRKSWMTPENALHFLRFAWASYGWHTYMLSHPCTWLCTLWNGIRCCTCVRQSSSGKVVGDNCCECNTAAVHTLAKVGPEDLVYCSFENGVYKVPFFVALDHESQSVLVVARGTASMDDLLTDLSMTHGDLDGLSAEGGRCNLGVLRSAQRMRPLLDGPLEEAFRRHPHYRLVLTGHSLGGSVTAVLALMMRSRYPDVQCYAYSPTAIFDRDLATMSHDCVLTVVVGDDVVVRTGMAQFLDFKRRALSAFLESDEPKHKLLSQGCLAVCCGARITPATYSPEEASSANGADRVIDVQQAIPRNGVEKESTVDLTQILNSALANGPQYPMLYPPGRILHLTECSSGYRASWAPAECFDHIVLSPRMFSDHLPDAIMRALRSVKEQSLVHHL